MRIDVSLGLPTANAASATSVTCRPTYVGVMRSRILHRASGIARHATIQYTHRPIHIGSIEAYWSDTAQTHRPRSSAASLSYQTPRADEIFTFINVSKMVAQLLATSAGKVVHFTSVQFNNEFPRRRGTKSVSAMLASLLVGLIQGGPKNEALYIFPNI